MTRQEKVRLTWLVNIAVVCLGFGLMMPAMRKVSLRQVLQVIQY